MWWFKGMEAWSKAHRAEQETRSSRRGWDDYRGTTAAATGDDWHRASRKFHVCPTTSHPTPMLHARRRKSKRSSLHIALHPLTMIEVTRPPQCRCVSPRLFLKKSDGFECLRSIFLLLPLLHDMGWGRPFH